MPTFTLPERNEALAARSTPAHGFHDRPEHLPADSPLDAVTSAHGHPLWGGAQSGKERKGIGSLDGRSAAIVESGVRLEGRREYWPAATGANGQTAPMVMWPGFAKASSVGRAAGRRGMVGGQEDMLVDIALDLVALSAPG